MNKPKLNDYDEENQELIKMLQPKSKVVTRAISHKEYYYPLEGEITDFDDYRDLVEILLTANPGDVVRIYIDSNGGSLPISDMIVSRISECQSREVTVIAELGFSVCSAATYIALACSDLIISPQLQWMIHNWSCWGGYGHTENLIKDIEFQNKQSIQFMKNVYSGFLNPSEMEDILKHPRDMWFNANEVAERWENMQAYRQAEMERMIAEYKAQQEEASKPKPKKSTKKTK